MLTVQGWNQDSCQNQTLVLPDGTSVGLTLNYVPMQYGWFIQSLTYGTFAVNNLRMVTSPNILNQYRNQLPFGLACFTLDGNDSTQQPDLSSGYATLYILTAAEVAQLAGLISGNSG